MNIGSRIKQRRIELGLDADELARKIGKSRATVYRYENGDIENMPTSVLEPIAKALETTPAYLMGWNIESDGSSDEDNLAKVTALSSAYDVVNSAFGSDAEELLETYNSLNLTGRHEALKRVKELAHLPIYSRPIDVTAAAHERTDTEVTNEMRRHDDDIMTNDSEWE